jgi:hypothetical protein
LVGTTTLLGGIRWLDSKLEGLNRL